MRQTNNGLPSVIPLLILLLVLVLIVFPIWAIIRIVSIGNENKSLFARLAELEHEHRALRDRLAGTPRAPVPKEHPSVDAAARLPHTAPAPTFAPPPISPVAPPPVSASSPLPSVRVRPLDAPVPPLAVPIFTPVSATTAPAGEMAGQRSVVPPPRPAYTSPPPRRSQINWEQFTGAKLLAWAGGLAAFLGAAFFVKYSFEHDLIPPEVRVALGFLFGLSLIIAGLKINRTRYAATVHTLCATGIVVLYAVTFACNSIYHFAFFGPLATFGLMSLITATAFLLAVRLDAQPVAVLGFLGGFLTPVLLSTGRDNPPGLFGYIALLDVGLIAVALRQRWHYLVGLAAAGTIVMQFSWGAKFLSPAKAPVAMVVALGFCALFLAAYFVARKVRGEQPVSSQFIWSAVAFPFVAFVFAGVFLDYRAIALRPGLLFSFVLLADCALLTLAWADEELPKLPFVSGFAVFGLLAAWTNSRLSTELLPWALAIYLGFAILHTAFPLVLERRRPSAAPTWWSQLFPPLTLLLMMGSLFKLDTVSLLLWPAILLVDILAIGLAVMTASLATVGIVLVLTLAATGVWLFRSPGTAQSPTEFLFIIGGFAIIFFVAGIYLARRMAADGVDLNGPGRKLFGNPRAQLPAFSALLPFLLLIMMTQRLALANPSPVFGLALLLIVLILGLSVVLTIDWLPLCALAGMAALEYAWHAKHFAASDPSTPLAWYLFVTAVFAIFPFLFRGRFLPLTGPWAVASLAGALHFPLVYRVIQRAWPNDVMGLLPAAFAVPPVLSLVAILRSKPVDQAARLNQLAWFGGVALLFITLIFPIQFSRQWITLGWALEGVALLWLFHRVPHEGLRALGVGLLMAAFARLALNPTVLEYHPRTGATVLNWYLYSFGTVVVCLFAGARLLAPPRERTLGLNAPVVLNTLGVVLAFLLLNIEIANAFAAPGSRSLVFQFSGNFARDMTYTIAWALFALGLLLISLWKTTQAGRYAALALIGVSLLKLFFHDLERLEALYRIGALFAVAVIAIVASVMYQRFLPGEDKTQP